MNPLDRLTGLITVLSTLISAFALAAVAISLRLQRKQVKAGQIQAHLTFHIELMRMAIDRPHLRTVWGPGLSAPDSTDWEQNVYRNLVIRYLLFSRHLDIAAASNEQLKLQLPILFASAEAREWWEKARSFFMTNYKAQADRDFIVLVEQAWSTAHSTQHRPQSPDASK